MIEIRMGIQTGADNTKKLFKRNIPNDTVLKACKIINSFKGLKVSYDFILDIPWESEEDILETLRLIIQIPKPYVLNLFSLTFFPGTELYDKAVRDKIITDSKCQVYRKDYDAIKNDYLNLLFFLFSKNHIPKRFEEYLISEKVLRSKIKRQIFCTLIGAYKRIDHIKDLVIILLKNIVKLDITRTIFLIKKKYYYSKTK
jgi:radical SAM superfamily enzyme YgiQ (UPF0313 family)